MKTNDPVSARLNEAIGLLRAAVQQIELAKGRAELTDQQLRVLQNSMAILSGMKPRSVADTERWQQAAQSGEEAWIVYRSSATGKPVEARYFSHLPSELRRMFD